MFFVKKYEKKVATYPRVYTVIAAAPAAAVVFFAVQFTISQAGIAAQTLTLIIRFQRKKKEYVAK